MGVSIFCVVGMEAVLCQQRLRYIPHILPPPRDKGALRALQRGAAITCRQCGQKRGQTLFRAAPRSEQYHSDRQRQAFGSASN